MERNIFFTLLGLILATVIYNLFNINILFLYILLISIFTFTSFDKSSKFLLLAGFVILINIFLGRAGANFYEPGTILSVDGQVVDLKDYDQGYKRILVKDKSKKKFYIGGKNLEDISKGDYVRAEIEITEISENKNFNLPSIRSYYQRENIWGSAKALALTKYENTKFLSSSKYRLLKKIDQSIEENLSADNSPIIKKLVLADSSSLGKDTRQAYSDAGLAHLLAISGLHIYIIIFCLDLLLKKVNLSYNLRFSFIIVVLTFYAYILDFTPSVSRAILMYALKGVFEISNRKVSNLSVVFISLIIILSLKPMAIFDLGLQLSYLSVLGILILNPRLNPKRQEGIYGLFTLYASVNIMILPLLIYNFNNFNIFSFFINLLISPVIIFILILSYLAILLDLIFSLNFLYLFIDQILTASNFYLQVFLEKFDFYLRLYQPSLGQVFLYYLSLFLLLKKSLHKKIYQYRVIGYCIFTLGLCINFYNLLNPKLLVGFFDVGQGDSAYLSYKNTYIQIDTGGSTYSSYNPGIEVTRKAIKKRGIRKIDLLILSHFDADHVLGTKSLIEDGLVKALLINGPEEDNVIYKDIMATGVKPFYPKEKLFIDKDFYLEFLNTDIENIRESNDRSLVVLANYKGKRILFTGDIGENVERKLKGSFGPVDILKVSHHGSKYSSTRDFLKETRPAYAIISVGAKNSYGHPDPDVLKNLSYVKAKILRTDQVGEIVFEIGNEISYTTAGSKKISIFAYERLGIFVIIFLGSLYYIKEKEADNDLQRF